MRNFSHSYRRLNRPQQQAVDNIEGPLLVLAGPGTGKTELLAMRVGNILRQTDTPPESILCLTFTDSAAHNMRERLVGLIGQAAYDITISTYHSFGLELLRGYPEYFGPVAGSRPIDELDRDQLLRQLMAEAPYSNPLKWLQVPPSDLASLISDFKHALIDPRQLKVIMAANRHFLRLAAAAVRRHLAHISRINKETVAAFKPLVDLAAPAAALPEPVQSLAVFWQNELRQALQYFDYSGKTTELTRWKNRWLLRQPDGKWGVAGLDAATRLSGLADIYSNYQRELLRLSQHDFDDMILQAISALTTTPALRLMLQERYLYLLLDEFQDTNESQLRLVQLLVDNPLYEGRPNVMAVGDDDQAIFAFQGADYSHMKRFLHSYRQTTIVTLTENYRFGPELAELASRIANQIEQRFAKQVEVDKLLRPAPNAHTDVLRLQFKSDVAQHAWVAKEAKRLVSGGMAPSQIAILAPKHRYLEPVIAFLRAAALPVIYEKRDNVLDDAHITQLARLAQLVVALAEGNTAEANHLWPQVISFDFWQLPTAYLWQLSWRADESRQPWTDVLLSQTDTRPIALFAIRLSRLAAVERLETMLDYLIGIQPIELLDRSTPLYYSPFYKHYFRQIDSGSAGYWDILSNLTVLRQHLRRYRAADDQPLYLSDLLQFIDAHQRAELPILNTSPYQEAVEAVNVMTAYKAKGQEFEAVFVLAASDEVWGSAARSRTSRVSLPPNLRFVRYAGQTEDERLRLFYVAITRAKKKLYITNFERDYAGRGYSRLKYLNESQSEAGQLISPLLPKAQRAVRQPDIKPPAVRELSAYWQGRHYQGAKQAALRALLAKRLEHYRLSPSHLTSFLDVIYEGPRRFFMSKILRFPPASSPESLYGTAIHETLQWLHLYRRQKGRLPSRRAALKYFADRLHRAKLGPIRQPALLERGQRAVEAYLTQQGHRIRAESLIEHDFTSEAVHLDDIRLGGKADQIIIDRAKRQLTIVDFKTGKSRLRWQGQDVSLHKYRQQLYFYKLLIEHSRSLNNLQVVGGELVFVEPAENGKINVLGLHFKDDDQSRLERLVSIVWRHIMELEFPETDHYPADIRGVLQFEDDLLAGRL